MKMKRMGILLTTLALGVFAAHAGAATVNSGIYDSIDKAFEDMQDGDTLVLTKDAETTESITITGNYTLDLNGKTWSSKAINITGLLTIKDSLNNTEKSPPTAKAAILT